MIHEQIGNKMVGCKINSKIMPIITPLHNGDIVEILTSEQSHGPSRDWLKFVKSSCARNRINQWFKKAQRSENIEKGKDILEKEAKKLPVKQSELMSNPEWIKFVLEKYHFGGLDDMYASIGFGGISATKVLARLLEKYNDAHEDEHYEKKIEELVFSKTSTYKPSKSGVIVKGIDNCLVKLSKCCNPLPGDSIIGYITKGRGVSVHRTNCPNINELLEDKDRIIDVYWYEDIKGSYIVDIEIFATDRSGLLKDILKQVENTKAKLVGVNSRTTREKVAIICLSLQTENITELNKLVSQINKVEGVFEVKRKRG
jgi:GTP pyrophosphokinase